MQINEQNQKIFTIGNKIVCLTIDDSFNFDIDDMLKIDYGNILGEQLTFALIVNKFGLLLADIENHLSLQKNDLENTQTKLKKEQARAFNRAMDGLKLDGIKSATVADCTNKAIEDIKVLDVENELQLVKLKTIEIEKDRGYINTIYWSAKAKLDIITKMVDKLSPREFEHEIMDGKINGILIKCSQKLIKDVK